GEGALGDVALGLALDADIGGSRHGLLPCFVDVEAGWAMAPSVMTRGLSQSVCQPVGESFFPFKNRCLEIFFGMLTPPQTG
ncbi:hypothetical protein ACIUX1_31160, partial [Pseudomonas aeruginosa]